MIRTLKWMALLAFISAVFAPLSLFTKVLLFALGLLLSAFALVAGLARWIKQDDRLPAWDEIRSVPPIVPEPPFTGGGPMGRWIADLVSRWWLKRLKRGEDDQAYRNFIAEAFDAGTKSTPKDPAEAMRRYKALVGGDAATATGPLYAKLRIAEMYEDGEGVEQDLEEAARIYRTIPYCASAMLHFAIAHVEGKRAPRDYVEAYKWLLLADKYRSLNPPTLNEIRIQPQRHRENRRHIRVRELMGILEPRLSPEQIVNATEAARVWWNANR